MALHAAYACAAEVRAHYVLLCGHQIERAEPELANEIRQRSALITLAEGTRSWSNAELRARAESAVLAHMDRSETC